VLASAQTLSLISSYLIETTGRVGSLGTVASPRRSRTTESLDATLRSRGSKSPETRRGGLVARYSFASADLEANEHREEGPFFCNSKPLHLLCEHISNTALRLNDLRRAGVVLQFAAKAENLYVDAAIEDIFVNAGRLQ
jgi:hypothetical protein